jgi:hypothetical protein
MNTSPLLGEEGRGVHWPRNAQQDPGNFLAAPAADPPPVSFPTRGEEYDYLHTQQGTAADRGRPAHGARAHGRTRLTNVSCPAAVAY